MSDKAPSEQQLVAAATDPDSFGAAQLAHILNANSAESGRQSAFDCLELWGNYPDHMEPLYAAANLFYESGNSHLGLMVAEYATTMRERPRGNAQWPLHDEATGWRLDLLYARLLVQVGRVAEAMAHYGSVLASCEVTMRRELADEVASVARRLPLCDVRSA